MAGLVAAQVTLERVQEAPTKNAVAAASDAAAASSRDPAKPVAASKTSPSAAPLPAGLWAPLGPTVTEPPAAQPDAAAASAQKGPVASTTAASTSSGDTATATATAAAASDGAGREHQIVTIHGCLAEGVGLGLDNDNRVTLLRPGGPAAVSGLLKIGDRVLSVDGAVLSGRQLQDVMQKLDTHVFSVEPLGAKSLEQAFPEVHRKVSVDSQSGGLMGGGLSPRSKSPGRSARWSFSK